ncbi:MAG: citrate/2-methylcitrate synthase [Acidobacteriota bacterium]
MTDNLPAGSEATPTVHEGLEGVFAARTRLSRVDGAGGRLVLAGYELEDLAPRASFEEVVHLLWRGELPSPEQEARLAEALGSETLNETTRQVLRGAVDQGASIVEGLRMGLAVQVCDEDPRIAARQILGRMPSMLAALCRLRLGLEPVESEADSVAARFLEALLGDRATAEQVRGLETYLNTVADHGLNASTFTARVIVSTRSDLVSALTGALGALKGPLHGGAPGPVLDTLLEVGTAECAEQVLAEKLARGERLMGFGHRVYEVRDPRAEVLRAAARDVLAADTALLALAGVCGLGLARRR